MHSFEFPKVSRGFLSNPGDLTLLRSNCCHNCTNPKIFLRIYLIYNAIHILELINRANICHCAIYASREYSVRSAYWYTNKNGNIGTMIIFDEKTIDLLSNKRSMEKTLE